MFRFLKNRRKTALKGAKTPSGEVADTNDEGATRSTTASETEVAAAPGSGGEVILTSIKSTDPDSFGAVSYPEPVAPSDGVVAAKSPLKDKSNGSKNGVDRKDIGTVAMEIIPEETPFSGEDTKEGQAGKSQDEEPARGGLSERELQTENPYAYVDVGEADALEDGDSVVTVIEKRTAGDASTLAAASEGSEDNNSQGPTYATVCKPATAQRLRAKAENLDDRYTPEKELLDDERQEMLQAENLVDSLSGGNEADDDDQYLGASGGAPPGAGGAAAHPAEEFIIYVSEDTLRKAGSAAGGGRPRDPGDIVVEPPSFSTFDSPERQSSLRERDRERRPALDVRRRAGDGQRDVDEDVDNVDDQGQLPLPPRGEGGRAYGRQLSAPEYPTAREQQEGVERQRDYNYDRGPRDLDPHLAYGRGGSDYPNDAIDQGSDRDYPNHPYNEYDSDRSDYENYRSYDYRRRAHPPHARHNEDPAIFLRAANPYTGYIERTHSMPTIRHDRKPMYGYPHYPPQGYDGPSSSGRRRQRSQSGKRRPLMDYDSHRERQRHRYAYPPDHHHRRLHHPDPYLGKPYTPQDARYPKGQPNGYIGPSREHDGRLAPMQNGVGPRGSPHSHGKNKAGEGTLERGQPTSRGSPVHSTTSSDHSGMPRRHDPQPQQQQRVSFKDTVEETPANNNNNNDQKGLPNDAEGTVNRNGQQFTQIVPEERQDLTRKPLLLTGDVDAVSVASDVSLDDLQPRRLQVRRSVAIWFAWFCMGLFTEVVGPNIPYLQNRINGTYDDIALSLASRGGGLLLGSSVGGLLCAVAPDWLDLWISTSLILGALCTSAVPWSMNLLHLCLTLGLSGFSKGFLQVATVTLAFSLWAEQGALYVIFFIHMAYAVGAAPCAQLTFLFDTGVLEQLLLGTNASSSTDGGDSSAANGGGASYQEAVSDAGAGDGKRDIFNVLDYIPRPMYPFDVAAVLTFVCGAVFLVFLGSAMRGSPRARVMSEKVKALEQRRLDALRPKGWFVPGSCGGRAALSVGIFFILPMGLVAVLGNFHHLYLLGSVPTMARSQALLLQTVFWGAMAIGRLLAPLSSRCLTANGLTICCLTVSILSPALMVVYGEKYNIFFWVFTLFVGLFVGPVLPAGLTLCNLCIRPTAMGVAVAFFWQAVGDGAFSWVAAFLLGHYLPQYLLYTALSSAGAAFFLYLFIIPLLARKTSKNNRKKKPKGKAIG